MSRQTTKTEKTIFWAVFFILIPVFGCLGDRPAAVAKKEGAFERARQWVSAAFHVVLPLFVLTNFGVWGFALIPLMVLVTARRHSAWKASAPYLAKKLYGDISEVLQGAKVRTVVLCGTAAALLLQVVTLFWNPVNFFAAVAATIVWATWLYIAIRASQENVNRRRDTENHILLLSKAYSVPVAEWTNSLVVDEGMRLTVTPPPLGAVLHYPQADGILELLAPEWEMNHGESNEQILVLDAVSEETVQRRLEVARSGGFNTGKITEAQTQTDAPVLAGVTITAADLV